MCIGVTRAWSGDLDHVLELANQDESALRLLDSAIAVDQLLEPDTPAWQTRARVFQILDTLRGMDDFGPTPLERMGTVIRYMYTPGPWNDFQPYSYDFDDPFGKLNASSKSLAKLLRTRKGNCISLPLLVTILGQELGANVKLSKAPLHVFAKFTDSDGTVTNIEATSGTLTTDESLIRRLEITQQALDSGIYLEPLSQRQSLSVLLEAVGQNYQRSGDLDATFFVADLRLALNPKAVNAMITKGNVYSLRLNQALAEIRALDLPITPDLKFEVLDPLYVQNLHWFAMAESFGWRQPDDQFNQRYLESIAKERAEQRP